MPVRDLLLYPLGGALLGLGLAALVIQVDPSLPNASSAGGLIAIAILLGAGTVVVTYARRRKPRAKGTKAESHGKGQDAVRSNITITIPAIGEAYPDVWGAGEPLQVVIRAPEGAAVSLAFGTRALGVARAQGGMTKFTFESPTPETADLIAQAAIGGTRTRATRELRIVRYDEEVRDLVRAFHEWAIEQFPDARDALTAREVLRVLRAKLGDSVGESLAQAIREFELVAYGERAADRATYIRVVDALAIVVEATEATVATSAAAATAVSPVETGAIPQRPSRASAVAAVRAAERRGEKAEETPRMSADA
ncbi:MAG: hypothetical protein ACYDDF_09535 [Thermoplasmatota archaeon]